MDDRGRQPSEPGTGAIHVSCFITAANRATPVFELVPQRPAVRCVSRRPRDGTGSAEDLASAAAATASSSPSLQAEWNFHAVFRPSGSSPADSHAAAFYREVSQPALRCACDGINTNVVAWGVHPTQKFRLLFGRSTGVAASAAQAPGAEALSESDALEHYGQLGALLRELFARGSCSRQQSGDDWRLGMSSWLVVNNQVLDLLQPPPAGSTASPTAKPLAFVSLEARSLAAACGILQMAKTNRVVLKQHAEHAHFFVRLALFHRGQVSTLHVVDLVDLRDFDDPVAADEKRELLLILQTLRQPPLSSRQAAGVKQQRSRGPSSSPSPPPSPPSDRRSSGSRTPPRPLSPPTQSYATALANFMLPLLTANAQTFLYANVIDSRSSLRESVALLNAVANLRGFVCPCRRLTGVSFMQLGFQPPAADVDREDVHPDAATASFEAQAVVAVGESLLSQLAGPSPVVRGRSSPFASKWPSPSSPPPFPKVSRQRSESPKLDAAAETSDSSEAMRWLDAFQQRKREILGARVDTVAPAADVVSLANSRVQAARARSDGSLEQGQPSPSPGSVSEIYEQLRRSMLAAETGGESPAPPAHRSFLPTEDRHNAPHSDFSPPSTWVAPLTMFGTQKHREVEAHERFGVDLDALAAVSPARPPSQCSSRSRSSSKSDDGCARLAVSTPSAPLPTREGFEPPCSSETTDWDRIVLPQSTEQVPSPSSHRQQRHLPPSPSVPPPPPQPSMLSSDAPSRRLSPPRSLTTGDFEAQCVRAGVPSAPVAAPNVDGLDSRTADRVQAADAALLRKNYDALLIIVREQQQQREAAEARAAEAENDREEVRAAFEVQIENMKLDNVALRRKVRLLEKRSGAQEALEQYDRDVQALQKQVHQFQERNVALELKLASPDGLGGGGIDLKKKYQHVVDEKLKLEEELAVFRKRERQVLVYSKLVGDSTRKVDQLSRDLSEKEQALAATRLGKLRLNAEMNQAVEKAELLHQENEKLLLDKAATTEELVATKMYLASLEAERKKAEVLDRFVQKHGYRMSELRQDQPVAGGGRYARDSSHPQPWRRDSEAKECEERLFAAVKRSLPQAVPLVNKLLRRLELQELSLREFSAREVDFINMLVELVSDQPAANLKRMIEEEMLKLQVC